MNSHRAPRLSSFVRSALFLAAVTASAQTFVVTPTTSLQLETANNTSAADSFAGQSNGNAAAGNVSKRDIRTLLYNGATTGIYAHFMPWFGQPNHINVGYNSADSAQVTMQVTDMLSRGIKGVVIDWYGPTFTVENNTTLLMKSEAESRSEPFEFAVMEDVGALNKCAQTSGCSVTQKLISDLQYALSTYVTSPRYLQLDGRPVFFFFAVDQYTIDWNAVRSAMPVNPTPIFIFQGVSGLSHAQSDGAFSWISPNASNPDDEGLTYLDNFYNNAKLKTGAYVFGSAYPGFDNSLAPWMAGKTPKIMKQHCGQTWLDSLARAGQHYSSTDQLLALQLVTWNDYEEGTEIESGIKNCVAVTAQMGGAALTWSITGQENTIHHYNVFISADGTNLMKLGEVPAGTHSYDLGQFHLDPAATYALFVQAYGQASLKNQMSEPVSYTPSNLPPVAQLSVNPTNGVAPLAVIASTAGSSDPDGTVASSSIDFGDGAVMSGLAASHTYNSAGNYTVKATVTDNLGSSSTASASLTVLGCAISATDRTITICAPVANSSQTSPVHIVAYATDSKSISMMSVYVDGVKKYQVKYTKSIDTSIAMAAGLRKITIQAKDSAGTFKATLYITVQ
jgi:PKD repeat protein